MIEVEQNYVHSFCRRNKDLLNQSDLAGCFYCRKIFVAKEVKKFVDVNGQTALCPYCGVDSVIPGICIALTCDLLEEMSKFWFGIGEKTNG